MRASIVEANFTIKAHKSAEVLKRWKTMNLEQFNHQKQGAVWQAGEKTQIFYSWMSPDYDQKAHSACDILKELGFDVLSLDNGDINILGYNKFIGQEQLFLTQIQDLIDSGQYLIWRCEKGEFRVWYFDGNKLIDIDYIDKNIQQLSNLKSSINDLKGSQKDTAKNISYSKKKNRIFLD